MGRGSSGLKTVSGGSASFVGKRVTDIELAKDNIEEQFGLRDLTPAQKSTLLNVFRGMAKNDYSYDKNKTPYEIDYIEITQPFIDGLSKSTDVFVNIETGGNTGREYVDSMDNRYRRFYIGKRGGAYVYVNGGRRRSVSGFDVMFGKKDL